MKTNLFICTMVFFLLTLTVSAQDKKKSENPDPADSRAVIPYWHNSPEMEIRNPGFQGGVDFGIIPPSPNSETKSLYTHLVLSVFYTKGKFRIGLRIPISFRLTLTNNPTFEFNTKNWIPTDLYQGLEYYFSMLDITYATPDDPVYLKFGVLKGIRLGNGAIVNRYRNDLFQPNLYIPGFALNFDPIIWNFPYIGVQGFLGNVGKQDLFGGRLFFRPFAFLKKSAARLMEIGATVVMDRSPISDAILTQQQTGSLQSTNTYNTLLDLRSLPTMSMPIIYGADVRIPVVAQKLFSMDIHGDYVYQNSSHGGRLGLDMRIIRFIYLSVIAAYSQKNLQFEYVNENYDTMKTTRYLTYMGINEKPSGFDWKFHGGLFFLQNKLSIEVLAGGQFTLAHPFTMRAQFSLHEGLIPALKGFSLSIYYEKLQFNTIQELAELKNSTIGGEIGLRIRPVVLRCSVKVLNALFTDTGWKLASDIGVSVSF